jgi:Oxidoreductase family, C-terminal alpha/beta domain
MDTLIPCRRSRHDKQILCVKSRTKPSGHSTVTRYGHVACHAAAISWRLGRKLRFDPATESFPDDAEANKMRDHTRRAGFQV